MMHIKPDAEAWKARVGEFIERDSNPGNHGKLISVETVPGDNAEFILLRVQPKRKGATAEKWNALNCSPILKPELYSASHMARLHHVGGVLDSPSINGPALFRLIHPNDRDTARLVHAAISLSEARKTLEDAVAEFSEQSSETPDRQR